MSDVERLKELERRYATERDNTSLGEEILRLRQRLGMTESGTIARKQDPVLMERFKAALGKKKKLTRDDAVRLIDIYFRFHGYSVDRHGSYVKGMRKNKITSRNIQSFRGGPGNWVKTGSESLIDFATRVAAIVLAEDEDSAGRNLSLANREKKAKAADKKSKEKERLLSYDIALAMISSSLSPRERKDVLLYQAENEWKLPGGLVSEIEDFQRHVLDELNHGVKMSPSDISNIVSLRNPPILFPSNGKRPDKIHWKQSDIDITVSFDGRTSDYMNANHWLYAISFGNSGIDPFTLSFRSETAAYLGDKTNVLSGGIMQDYHSKNIHGFVSLFIAPKDGRLDNLFRMAAELFAGYGLSTYELMLSKSEYRDVYDLIDRKVIHVHSFHRDVESGEISRITVLTRGDYAPGQGYLFEMSS